MIKNIADGFYEMMNILHKNIFNTNDMAKKLPIPLSHINVLHYLSDNSPAIISDIANELQICRPNMTPIIDMLLEEKLINKYPNPKDKRYYFIEITEKGNEIISLKKKYIKEAMNSYLSNIDNENLDKLESSVEEILKILKNQ